jgi:8-oxo-dGTP diphosphatase
VSSGERLDRLYPSRPILGALAVVRRGARVLLVQRAIPPSVGKWGFPGGMQELGETCHQCALRELEEETGISGAAVATIDHLDVIQRDEDGRVRFHFALVCVLVDWRSGEGEPRDEALDLGWFTPEEVLARGLETFPAALPLMRRALADTCAGSP